MERILSDRAVCVGGLGLMSAALCSASDELQRNVLGPEVIIDGAAGTLNHPFIESALARTDREATRRAKHGGCLAAADIPPCLGRGSMLQTARKMAWYHRVPAPKLPPEKRKSRMEGLWIRCDG